MHKSGGSRRGNPWFHLFVAVARNMDRWTVRLQSWQVLSAASIRWSA